MLEWTSINSVPPYNKHQSNEPNATSTHTYTHTPIWNQYLGKHIVSYRWLAMLPRQCKHQVCKRMEEQCTATCKGHKRSNVWLRPAPTQASHYDNIDIANETYAFRIRCAFKWLSSRGCAKHAPQTIYRDRSHTLNQMSCNMFRFRRTILHIYICRIRMWFC